MFMDVSTEIVLGYQVHDADNRERGPVRVRDALKYSLNIPVTKAQQLIGTENVVTQAERLGLHWDPSQDPNVASLTLGTVGVRMIDLAAAYGTLANGGVYNEPYQIERILDRDGNVLYDHAVDGPDPAQAISPQSAYLVTDILADNTDPAQNPLWGPDSSCQTPSGRRPATLKTGTTTDFKDLQAFGYIAADVDPEIDEGAIITGVWVGNSDFSAIDSVFAADGPTFIWHDYMAEVTALNALPVRDFVRPDGITERTIDTHDRAGAGRVHQVHDGRGVLRQRAWPGDRRLAPRARDRGHDRQDLAGRVRRLRAANAGTIGGAGPHRRARAHTASVGAGPACVPRPAALGRIASRLGSVEQGVDRPQPRPRDGHPPLTAGRARFAAGSDRDSAPRARFRHPLRHPSRTPTPAATPTPVETPTPTPEPSPSI